MKVKVFCNPDRRIHKGGIKPKVNDKGIVKVGGGLFIDCFPPEYNLAIHLELDSKDKNRVMTRVVAKLQGEYYSAMFSLEDTGTFYSVLNDPFFIKTYDLSVPFLQDFCVEMVRQVRAVDLLLKVA